MRYTRRNVLIRQTGPVPTAAPPPDVPVPPGVVIAHSPATTHCYIGSPSIALLSHGGYVVAHDFFGPGSKCNHTVVYRSSDYGEQWTKLAELDGQFWSTLFAHRGMLYIVGTSKEYGTAVIRRSQDGGRLWSDPVALCAGSEFHCGPVPVLVHDGRIWRAFERRDPPTGWGVNFRAGMLSAPVDAQLLDPASWTSSNFLRGNTNWLGGTFGGWLEGNAVVTRDGRLVDMLRVDTSGYPEKAALVHISKNGRTAKFHADTGFIDVPGGAKKFTVRFDQKSDRYWSLATVVPKEFQQGPPGNVRNTLALISSADLAKWTVHAAVLQHQDTAKHGFQYVDWHFEDKDIVAVCSTAFDDEHGGAHTFHDANYLTFHRIEGFRRMGAST